MVKDYCAWSVSTNEVSSEFSPTSLQDLTLKNEGGKMNKKVYVANLPFQASEPELKTLFSKAGDVMSVKIVTDRQTGQPRGIAFVEMSTQWEARRAVSMLNRTDFMGKILLVKEAIVKRGFRGR
jgi:RNA recognition motif-containing protein